MAATQAIVGALVLDAPTLMPPLSCVAVRVVAASVAVAADGGCAGDVRAVCVRCPM